MQSSNLPNHAQHDLDLIAASIDGDLTPAQQSAADALLATCNACADLRRDIIALASATRALPRTAAASRDFRLDASQAARLRRGGVLRRLLRPLAAPRSAVRPMAAAFTTLGLAGLLVANILPALLGGASGGAARDRLNYGPAPAISSGAEATNAPAAVPVAGQGGGPQTTSGGGDSHDFQAAQSSPAMDQNGKAESAASEPPRILSGGNGEPTSGRTPDPNEIATSPQANLVILGSLLLLGVGLGLFGLRFAARRLR